MKILTKEEEAEHYSATLRGGFFGGSLGLALGAAGVALGSRRFPIINHLTLPMKAFLVTSSGTFGTIIAADRSSRMFELERHPEQRYRDENDRLREQLAAGKSAKERFVDWGRENRYGIVGASWVASMAIALGLVGRNPYLTTSQKIVQARVYAQGLTLAVLVATAAFEVGDKNAGKGRYETVKIIDPDDPEHKRIIEKQVHHEAYAGEDQWKDMIATEERKLKQRQEAAHEVEKRHPPKAKGNGKNGASEKKEDTKKNETNKREQKDGSKKEEKKKDNKDKGGKGDDGEEEEEEDRGPVAQESDPKITGGEKKPPNLP